MSSPSFLLATADKLFGNPISHSHVSDSHKRSPNAGICMKTSDIRTHFVYIHIKQVEITVQKPGTHKLNLFNYCYKYTIIMTSQKSHTNRDSSLRNAQQHMQIKFLNQVCTWFLFMVLVCVCARTCMRICPEVANNQWHDMV